LIFTQGAALGWYVAALSGLRKTISDLWEAYFIHRQFWLHSNNLTLVIKKYKIIFSGNLIFEQLLKVSKFR
jgi:hypothetical protein